MSTERYAPDLSPDVPRPAAARAAVAASTALQSPDVVGSTLRHFRVDKRLASGGMGDVYLGFDTSLLRPVAIKTIRAELARDPAFLSRFTREAVAQANVVHPHVVQVYFVGEDRGISFLAMQVVDGGALHDALEPGKRLRWQDAARHMLDVCGGLVVAERLGIVHRDIKPANILLDKAGRALLSDFGLAASAGQAERAPQGDATVQPSGSQLQLANLTQVGVVMGTPEYVAPEQLKPGAAVDARADIYALGATFFHLLSGQPPSGARTLIDAMARFAEGKRAPPLRSVAPQVPARFAAVIDRCLAPDPAARFPTMAALFEALSRVQPQPMVAASPALRSLVWAIDVVPFLLLTALLYVRAPWLCPILFGFAGLGGARFLGSTPGIWLMRLRLRTVDDGDVSVARAFARFLVQHGWYLPLTLGFSALYASSGLDVLLIPGAAWLLISLLGSAGAFSRRAQTLHDGLTKTRVLVDTRWRAA